MRVEYDVLISGSSRGARGTSWSDMQTQGDSPSPGSTLCIG